MSGTVKLPRGQVDWLLRGALAAAGKELVTPVLCALQWTIADGRVTVIATDRYRVHQLYVRAPKGTPDGQFLMDRFQAETMLRMRHSNARRLSGEVVELTWTDPEPIPTPAPTRLSRRHIGTIRVDAIANGDADADVLSHTTDQVHGTFPPVARLFPSTDGDEVRAHDLMLNPDYLASLRFLRTDPYQPLRFVMPPAKDGKPGVVLVENQEGTARALLQPYVGSKPEGYGNG